MLIFRRAIFKFHIILFLFASLHAAGQYYSGITIPDSNMLKEEIDLPSRYASTITPDDLKSHLMIIASDEMQGRETGTTGNDLAASYLREQIQKLSINPLQNTPQYYQKIDLTSVRWVNTDLKSNDIIFRHLWDFLVFPYYHKSATEEEKEVIFLGYGIHDSRYSDYRNVNVKEKSILIFEGEPIKSDGTYWMTDTKNPSFWTTANKLKIAHRKRVKRVYVISNNIQNLLAENRSSIVGNATYFGDLKNDPPPIADHLYISSDMAKKVLGEDTDIVISKRNEINQTGNATSTKVKFPLGIVLERSVSSRSSQNVAAYIEGSTIKDEVVVVSAHYDHLGMRGEDIYNGADDNGSGTTALIEIMEAFQMAKNEGHVPKRSILFIWFTSEEKGLRGSQFYSENPLIPLENTVANVNVDMIGRKDDKHSENPYYIYVIGSDRLSSELHMINEEVNKLYTGLTLDYQYNDAQDPNRFYFRSDHYNFAKKGIPSIFFFSGTHRDYHRPSDTVDKILFDKYAIVCKLIFHNVWELSNRKDRIIVERGF